MSEDFIAFTVRSSGPQNENFFFLLLLPESLEPMTEIKEGSVRLDVIYVFRVPR